VVDRPRGLDWGEWSGGRSPRSRNHGASPRIVFASALMRAVFSGDLEVTELLLEHGADPHVKSGDRESMLQAAASLALIPGHQLERPLDNGWKSSTTTPSASAPSFRTIPWKTVRRPRPSCFDSWPNGASNTRHRNARCEGSLVPPRTSTPRRPEILRMRRVQSGKAVDGLAIGLNADEQLAIEPGQPE